MKLEFSAPGKIILFGEHAVVFGYPAIASSINLRTHLKLSEEKSVEKIQPPSYILNFRDLNSQPICVPYSDVIELCKQVCERDESCIEFAYSKSSELISTQNIIENKKIVLHSLAVFLLLHMHAHRNCLHTSCEAFKNKNSFSITIYSDLPLRAGLGSSAAFSVVIAACMLLIHGHINRHNFNQPNNLNLVKMLAHEAEKVFHTNPSGIDTTVCTFGGVICFKKDLDTQTTFPESLCNSSLSIAHEMVIINTNISRSTAKSVNQVSEAVLRNRGKIENIFTQIASISNDAILPIQTLLQNKMANLTECRLEISKLFTFNQKLLVDLGVSNSILDSVVNSLSNIGINTKITGAGNGGCAIAMPYDNHGAFVNIETIENSVKMFGVSVIQTIFCVPGLEINVD